MEQYTVKYKSNKVVFRCGNCLDKFEHMHEHVRYTLEGISLQLQKCLNVLSVSLWI